MKRGIFFLIAWIGFLSAGNVLHAQFKHWEQTNGPNNIIINTLAMNQVGNIYAGTNNGVYVTTNQGQDWVLLGLINSTVIDVAINPSRHLFAVQQDKGVFRSTNLGVNWNQVRVGKTNAIGINKRGDIYAATDSGVLRSIDNGATWSYLNLPLLKKALEIYINPRDYIFIGTQSAGVFKSTDNGASWINMNLMNTEVSVLFTVGDYVFAGSRFSGMYRALINSTSWTQANTGLASRDILCMTGNSADHVICGTGAAGVYRSRNLGVSWEDFNIGIPKQQVRALITSASDVVYLGTDKNKVWKSENSTVGAEQPERPTGFAIGLNYPNPFVSETVIPVSNNGRDVTLSVYNLLGKEVFSAEVHASAKSVAYVWNGITSTGRTTPPGTYVVRITDRQGITATRVMHKVSE